MYLTSIKLAGFKSFVDPTTVKFQSNLTAIVGPNGCGKSNVVDAIRWVIGESSAKNLRAESMADVIFNGTNKRKPVGQASIELVFDNSDGSLGGEYARFNEISIRRVLTRDCTSTYYLNNTRCRRKDIIDVFLGTGLGPRSYAIIEQGMISKLIEAKPAELRVYIEEAAGISKYKERRRETENRIKHTRENLERLLDLREELEKQLNRLKRQAGAAERYKVLKQQQREQKAQLSTLTWRNLQARYGELDSIIKEQSLTVEKTLANMHELDARIEEQRIHHTDQSDKVNDVQKMFYSIGNDITKLEQQINNAKERQAQLTTDIEHAQSSRADLLEQLTDDQDQLTTVSDDIANLENATSNFQQESDAVQEQLQVANDNMHQWQEQWENFQQSTQSTMRQVDVKQTQLDHLQQRKSTLNDRLQRKQQQYQEFEFEDLQQHIADDEQQSADYDEQQAAMQDSLHEINSRLKSTRDEQHETQVELNDLHSQLQRQQGRLSSLEVLQTAALHKNDDVQQQWLAQNNLTDSQRLAEIINAQAGWETAVETVLATHLQAVCVDDFTTLAGALSEVGQVSMSFMKKRSVNQNQPNTQTLLSKVECDLDLSGLLHGIYVAESLDDALQMAKSFETYESVVTKDGLWLSSNWLRIQNDECAQTGVLKRQHEIDELKTNVQTLQTRIEQQSETRDLAKETVLQLEEQRDDYQMQTRELNKQLSEIRSRLSSNRTKVEQLSQRQQQVMAEMEELTEQLTDVRTEIESTREELASIQQQAQEELNQKDALLDQKESLKGALEDVKITADLKKQRADEMQIRLQSNKSQVHYLQQGIDRAKQQLDQLQERSEKMTEQLEHVIENLPEWSEQLEELLEQRLTVETALTEQKQALNQIEATLRDDEKHRHEFDQQQQGIRDQLEQNRMDHQTIKVKSETLEQQIVESGFDRDTVLANLPDDINAKQLSDDIEQCETKINRLGPINLAAIEEYDEVKERKVYLDKQDEDLNEALTTLENAISKIDKETKTKFKDTFDHANKSFMEYFPQIFGGGNACLELVGDDLLDAGVLVKAQPPGKRNSTIHLLSGGEKALTAIALVFSLFQLNPAPFCILDEVDAPLDDANVVRYTNLVSAMSEKVQFIYISHNKIAIEMAKQLCGVTMHEPGVSRTVSVDIDEAVKMAESV